jgi:DNA repair and recombination protein RAD54B
MGKIAFHGPLLPGSSLKIGGKDVEVDSIVSKAVYQDIRRNQSTTYKPPKAAVPISVHPQKTVPSVPPKMGHVKIPEPTSKPYVEAPKSVAINRNFKNPLLSNTILAKVDGPKPTPRHDPHAENALVMRRPRSVPRGSQIVDVVVDPVLCKALRPHQREGIRFMYECVMGMRESGEGAILADEMGLGKTLQTIALLWTLLKQNPIYEAGPVIKKALIVCPVTLINNWRKEIKKWLGNERVGVFVADGAKINLRDFTMGRSYSIMIIGYERLRLVQEELKKGAGIDIVVADEGHRLKTAQNKSAQAILGLNTNRRIILSGTPIQNDLSEFFVMVDFVNPGLLGKYSKFKKDFE